MDGAVALNNFAKTLRMSGALDDNIPEPTARDTAPTTTHNRNAYYYSTYDKNTDARGGWVGTAACSRSGSKLIP